MSNRFVYSNCFDPDTRFVRILSTKKSDQMLIVIFNAFKIYT